MGLRARGAQPFPYTAEVKRAVLGVAANCRQLSVLDDHGRRLAPQAAAAALTGVSAATIASWSENFDPNVPAPPERRGGDRRSIEARDPEGADSALDLVKQFIANRHAEGLSASSNIIHEELKKHPEFIPFFKDARRVRDFLKKHGLKWRKSNKYDYYRSKPTLVEWRNRYIQRIVQNQYSHCVAAPLYSLAVLCMAGFSRSISGAQRCMVMSALYGRTRTVSGRGLLMRKTLRHSPRKVRKVNDGQ